MGKGVRLQICVLQLSKGEDFDTIQLKFLALSKVNSTKRYTLVNIHGSKCIDVKIMDIMHCKTMVIR